MVYHFEFIDFISYSNFTELKKALIQFLKEDIEKEKLLPSDIMVIDMDAIGSLSNRANIILSLLGTRELIHL